MKMLIAPLTLLFLFAVDAQAIKIAIFSDTETFVGRAKEIVIAKCIRPDPKSGDDDDGLYPVDVEITAILKGAKENTEYSRKLGKAKIATIYPMEAGKTYLLMSLGGSAFDTDFLAVPELSVVELPTSVRLDELMGKNAIERVNLIFAARRQQIERRLRELEEEKKSLDKAVKGK